MLVLSGTRERPLETAGVGGPVRLPLGLVLMLPTHRTHELACLCLPVFSVTTGFHFVLKAKIISSLYAMMIAVGSAMLPAGLRTP